MIDLSDPAALRAEAERRHRQRALGKPLHEDTAPDADRSWQDEQRAVWRVWIDAGCTAYWLSQARRTGQTPGVPDQIIFGPPGAPFLAFWEVKSGRGKLTPAQEQFRLNCVRCGVRFGSGGVSAARRMLAEWIKDSSVPQLRGEP